MIDCLNLTGYCLAPSFKSKAWLEAENIFPRHQLSVCAAGGAGATDELVAPRYDKAGSPSSGPGSEHRHPQDQEDSRCHPSRRR